MTNGALNTQTDTASCDDSQSGLIEWTVSVDHFSQNNDWHGFLEFIKNLRIPIIPDERKQRVFARYQKWGNYGWTPDPDENMYELLKTDPLDKNNADRRARKLFSNMNPVFASILQSKRCKKSDLEEAIADFNDKRYKSCSLMLFPLIDAQLIRLQRPDPNAIRRRKVGKKAVNEARKRSGVDEHKEWVVLAAYYYNVFACLETMFANGNDFNDEPEVINRNYLAHGMMKREVTRTNCVQLFLLYYNVLELHS